MKSFIVEGPDNAGKSNLVSALSKMLQMDIKHNVKPNSVEEFKDAMKFEMETTNTIFDRGMAISQAMYDIALNRQPLMPDEVLINYADLEVSTLPIIICMPPEHIVCSAPKGRPEMAGVAEKRAEIYQAYQGLLEATVDYPNVVIFDYTKHSVEDAIEWLVNAMGIANVH